MGEKSTTGSKGQADISAKKASQDYSGHRERMFSNFMACLPGEISPERLLELLLFFSIPRKDTYALSKELISRFGSFKAVFQAPVNELLEVEGIGMRTVQNLKIVLETAEMLHSEARSCSSLCTNEKKICEYLVFEFSGLLHEASVLMLFNDQKRMMEVIRIDGTYYDCRMDFNHLARKLDEHKPKYAIMAHNHTDSGSTPSYHDRAVTGALNELLEERGVELIGSYVVFNDRCTKIINE